MKVILLQDVPGTGKKNQVLNVSDGFARNYLIPRKWAREATDAAVREIEHRNKMERQKETERRAAAEAVADDLKDKVIVIRAKCGEKGRLYGSITGQEVADALRDQHQVDLDKRKVELTEPIRTVGESSAAVTLYPGLKIQMKVNVEPMD
ncbi:MAG: 50S ribosomal protein L9 [Clostridiales bacterium]|jgi:large subunit ribosomal protein L9|nr:50S ribosomal protein L9 [Clostridiales bacterium]